ncbi:Ppx/GppA family phosphatase [Pseudohalocynthiibacter aestuariivivens]|jgi:exopolyphosphatase / guanosine-5'-triphosphate,3'-diphosphate pyrophosphatase|uniref:Ppx/GppA family phosphatase n=1 Tax=Pseudohalocynthiibacter aestuariivivens TaxID=1591409 RepID=A0ABV5JD92_9RHOB|nr:MULTISPECIES: Ppx/GppA family phosphatase [Pseudohalocynthiibacter]MBS9715756.1 Ppx/GppA family phosphatase [Pseudohalocynthiibacter aestuariivivens]MCK0101369.1 Ppx/GppA family phosphatase [Pseudohalocynthiibacter sp. F2068]
MDGTAESGNEDWGFFGRPLFDDPSARALSRVGVVDIGSNSVRLVIFDGAARSPAYFFNEKIMCALGAGLSETGRLSPDGRKRALAAIKRFQFLAKGMSLAPLTAVATAAVREASDGRDFCDEVERETGLRIYVINGQEEARLSAQGVLLGWPTAQGIVCDIGGSSMELAEVAQGRVGQRLTSPLGPLKLKDIKGGKKGLISHIRTTIENLHSQLPGNHGRLFLVGGSWRAIARLDMARRGYPLTVLHEYRMTPKSVMATVNWIAENDLDELRSRTGTSEARMSLVPEASLVLKQLIRTYKPRDIAVSSYGIREGMLYEQMPERLRRRDPLIEACRFAEVKDARMPGFGKALYSFILPLFKSAKPDRIRLIKAACLLHDVTWRAHPDYRAEVCFDNATRANLGGLRHRERVFLGLSLLHRYKNSRADSRFEPLFGLLDEKEIKDAEVLGKAMRFGAMFSVEAPTKMGELRYFPKKRLLELILKPKAQPLFGEVAEARFYSLASALESETKVRVSR